MGGGSGAPGLVCAHNLTARRRGRSSQVVECNCSFCEGCLTDCIYNMCRATIPESILAKQQAEEDELLDYASDADGAAAPAAAAGGGGAGGAGGAGGGGLRCSRESAKKRKERTDLKIAAKMKVSLPCPACNLDAGLNIYMFGKRDEKNNQIEDARVHRGALRRGSDPRRPRVRPARAVRWGAFDPPSPLTRGGPLRPGRRQTW